jgi:hypothetical protein
MEGSTIRKALMFVIGMFIFVSILLFLGIDDTYNAIKKAESLPLFAALVFQGGILLIQAFRWKLIINSLDIHPPFNKVLEISLIGNFLNKITPIGYAGEPVKAYLFKKSGDMGMVMGMGTLLSERIFDFAFLLILAILGTGGMLWVYDMPFFMWYLLGILILGMSLFLIAFVTAFWKREYIYSFLHVLLNTGLRVLPKSISPKKSDHLLDVYLTAFSKTFFTTFTIKNVVSIGFITFIRWVLALGRTFFILVSLGFKVPMSVVATVVSISTLISFVPTSPGGIGVIESCMVFIYSLAGITKGVIGAATIIDRLIGFWLVAFAGWIIYLLWIRKV